MRRSTVFETASLNQLGHRSVDGAPGRVRTFDLRIKSPLLYRLSYERKKLKKINIFVWDFEEKMVRPPGLEPGTLGLKVPYSTN